MEPDNRLLARFRYPVNLVYAANQLRAEGIDCTGLTESGELWVHWTQFDQARDSLQKMDLDDEPVSEESEGYVDGYEEWINKQYLPGYFTGTTRPIWFKDKTLWKFMGPGLLILGLCLIGLMVPGLFKNGPGISTLVTGSIALAYVVIGYFMVMATWLKK